MTTKCILFDVDGVVIRTEMFSVQYEKKFGVSNDEMIPFFKGEFNDCLVGKADLKEVLKPWLPKWKFPGTVDEFLEFWFKVEDKPDKELLKEIEKLRKDGVKCFLATKQEKYRMQYMMKQMGFGNYFDGSYASDNIGLKKPDRKYFEFVLNDLKEKYDFNPEEILFFDDQQENVDAAKELGIRAYFYDGIEVFREAISK